MSQYRTIKVSNSFKKTQKKKKKTQSLFYYCNLFYCDRVETWSIDCYILQQNLSISNLKWESRGKCDLWLVKQYEPDGGAKHFLSGVQCDIKE